MLLPQRTPQDKNGDIGEAAVRLIWNKAGSAAEKIGKDYGDDLLIQTGPDGRVDASRIWVQVKAREDTRGLRKLNGTKTLPVDIKNVLKWIRSLDLVVVVVWDPVEDIGWYEVIPGEQLQILLANVHERTLKSLPPLPLVISADKVFDVGAARQLAWQAQIAHATTRCRIFAQMAQDASSMNEYQHLSHQVRDVEGPTQAGKRVAMDLLHDIGILQAGEDGRARLSRAFQPILAEQLIRNRRETAEAGGTENLSAEELARLGAVFLACLEFVEAKAGTGLADPLMIWFSSILYGYIDECDAAAQRKTRPPPTSRTCLVVADAPSETR